MGEVTISPENLSACETSEVHWAAARYQIPLPSRHEGHSDTLSLRGEKVVTRANQHILPGLCLKVIVATEQQI